MADINDLPLDPMLHVFYNLDLTGIINFVNTSTTIHRLTGYDSFWMNVLQERFPLIEKPLPNMTWLQTLIHILYYDDPKYNPYTASNYDPKYYTPIREFPPNDFGMYTAGYLNRQDLLRHYKSQGGRIYYAVVGRSWHIPEDDTDTLQKFIEGYEDEFEKELGVVNTADGRKLINLYFNSRLDILKYHTNLQLWGNVWKYEVKYPSYKRKKFYYSLLNALKHPLSTMDRYIFGDY